MGLNNWGLFFEITAISVLDIMQHKASRFEAGLSWSSQADAVPPFCFEGRK